MNFLATSEPVRKECFEDPKGSYLHTIAERHAYADEHGARKIPMLPIIIEHGGFEFEEGTLQFKVPPWAHVGRVTESMVRDDGQFLQTGEIFHEYPELVDLIEKDTKEGRHWGVSLGKDLKLDAQRYDILGKTITHLGLSRMPKGGGAEEQGSTWIHLGCRDTPTFYRELGKLLEQEPSIYRHPKTKERQDRLIARAHAAENDKRDRKLLKRKRDEDEGETMHAETGTDSTTPLESAPVHTQAKVLDAAPFIAPVVNSPVFDMATSAPAAAAAVNTTPPLAAASSLPPAQTGAVAPLAATTPTPTPPVSDPMQGVTSTSNEHLPDFNPWLDKVVAFNREIYDDPEKRGKPKIEPELIEKAALLRRDFSDGPGKGLFVGNTPPTVIAGLSLIHDYLEGVTQSARTTEGVLSNNAEIRLQQEQSILDPLRNPRQNLPIMTSVVSNLNNTMKNADVWNTQFASQRNAQQEAEKQWKIKEDDFMKQLAGYKTKEEETGKELAALHSELESIKRARTDASAAALAAPARLNTGLAGHYPGAGAAGLPAHIPVPGAVTSNNSTTLVSVASSSDPSAMTGVTSTNTASHDLGAGRRFYEGSAKFASLRENWAPRSHNATTARDLNAVDRLGAQYTGITRLRNLGDKSRLFEAATTGHK